MNLSPFVGYRYQERYIKLFCFKIKSGKSADYMIEHFVPASSVHSYGTRFREK